MADSEQRHVMPPHCDKPGCCVGVIYGKCQRCGFEVYAGGSCPATADEEPVRIEWSEDGLTGTWVRTTRGPTFVCEQPAPGFNRKVTL